MDSKLPKSKRRRERTPLLKLIFRLLFSLIFIGISGTFITLGIYNYAGVAGKSALEENALLLIVFFGGMTGVPLGFYAYYRFVGWLARSRY